MFRLAREIYSLIEAVCSPTGRFGTAPSSQRGSSTPQAQPIPARNIETEVYIGVLAQEALEERMAAD